MWWVFGKYLLIDQRFSLLHLGTADVWDDHLWWGAVLCPRGCLAAFSCDSCKMFPVGQSCCQLRTTGVDRCTRQFPFAPSSQASLFHRLSLLLLWPCYSPLELFCSFGCCTVLLYCKLHRWGPVLLLQPQAHSMCPANESTKSKP
jgi:hypothetical protein